jgi:hypothetical protein
MKNITVLFLLLAGCWGTGCSPKTKPGKGGSGNTNNSDGSYVLLNADSVRKQGWSNEEITNYQYYLSKAVDYIVTERTKPSRTVGANGEIIYNDSITNRTIHFRSKCECIVVKIMNTNDWMLDCDEGDVGGIPLLRFKAADWRLYTNGREQVRDAQMGSILYEPTSSDVALTVKILNNKGTHKIEKVATGRKVTGK